MNGLGLSTEQIETRRKYVQAGDAARIMAGEWRAVWREKMGLDGGSDLSGVLAVQLGSFTEPLNLAWCAQTTGRPIEYFSGNALMRRVWNELRPANCRMAIEDELQVSNTYPFMACNLDGMTTTPQGHRCPIDAKHVGRADDAMVLRYTAAGTHQATVMGCDWWALSVLIGNSKHEVIYQEVDPLYQAQLIARCREFWGYVERGEEPEDRLEPALAPKPQPRLRTVSLDDGEFDPSTGQWTPPDGVTAPNWASEMVGLIYDYAGTHAAYTKHNIVREQMKQIVPDDVGTVLRGRFKWARDKAGSIRMNLTKEKTDGC